MDAEPPARPQFDLGVGSGTPPHSGHVFLLVDFINPLRFDGGPRMAPEALAAAKAALTLKGRLTERGVPARAGMRDARNRKA